MIAFLVGSVLVALCAAQSANAAETLETLRLQTETKVAALEKPVAELTAGYAQQLEKLAGQFQKQGKLQDLLAVRKEMDRLTQGQPRTEGPTPPELARLQDIYDREASKLREAIQAQTAKIYTAYVTLLEDSKKTLTQNNQVVEALKAQAEQQRVQALIDTLASSKTAPSALQAGAAETKMRMALDMVLTLCVRGNEAWFDQSGERGGGFTPGRNSQKDNPITLDGKDFFPTWINSVSSRMKMDSFTIPTNRLVDVRAVHTSGRGTVEVTEQPSPDNQYTVKLVMKDIGASWDWIEFRLAWKEK